MQSESLSSRQFKAACYALANATPSNRRPNKTPIGTYRGAGQPEVTHHQRLVAGGWFGVVGQAGTCLPSLSWSFRRLDHQWLDARTTPI